MASLLKQTGILALLLATLPAAANPVEESWTAPYPESLVVVANDAVEGSLEVARRYMAMRDIPEGNLVRLTVSDKERIDRPTFLETIRNPLLEALLEQELISGLLGGTDTLGRREVTLIDNPIRYLVLCYGVPVRINEWKSEDFDDRALRDRTFGKSQPQVLEAFSEGPLARNVASVDSELSLLFQKNLPLTGFVPNPYFGNAEPDTVRDILRVTRLDGPSPEAVFRMLDNTRMGEATGLRGRAYVDTDGRGGAYRAGNEWMETTADLFRKLGFDLDLHPDRQTYREDARFDAPVLYAGWYNPKVNGPFTLPGFRFPPGAIAAHLHSYSADRVRSSSQRWVGPLVERGVSATFGNVAEPFLRYTHRFDGFFAALAKGWSLADAAYFSMPVLSWTQITLGDPLYRPFAVRLEEQLKNTQASTDLLADQYVLLRRIRLMEAEGQTAEARQLAARAMRSVPGPALALAYAGQLEAAGQHKEAKRQLEFFLEIPPSDSLDWGLYAAIADFLMELGEPGMALRVYRHLDSDRVPEPVRLLFLERGLKAARQAGETELARQWDLRLNPPPPPPPESPPPEKPSDS